MWKKIVQIKIYNQTSILKLLKKNPEVIQRMIQFANSVEPGDATNREGIAAFIVF